MNNRNSIASNCILDESSIVNKSGSHGFGWSTGRPLFAKPWDTITWARHQMRSPAIIFHTMRPSGQKIYLILLIKYELNIEQGWMRSKIKLIENI